MALNLRFLPALLSLLYLVPVLTVADEAQLASADAREIVAGFIESTQSYRANFRQILYDENGEVVDEEAGRMWLVRPGKFRWNYEEPWVRQIVATEDNVWLYDADLDQVTVRPLEGELEQTPAALLVGQLEALDSYVVSGRLAGNFTEIMLEPIGDSSFRLIVLVFADGRLQRLDLDDSFGQRTQIFFTDAVANDELDGGLFEFVAPPGVDVLDQRAE